MNPAPSAALRVIVVEDHDLLREEIVHHLRQQGFAAEGAMCAADLDERLAQGGADAVVLDLNLPGEDGLSIARRLRQAMPQIGIVMLTGRGGVPDRVRGYESGADIYLPKPVGGEELVAALGSLHRRIAPPAPEPWQLDRAARRLTGPAGRAVALSDREATVIAALALAPQRTLETPALLLLVGGDDEEFEKSYLENLLSRLRRKLADLATDPALPTVRVVRNVGYQLCLPVEVR